MKTLIKLVLLGLIAAGIYVFAFVVPGADRKLNPVLKHNPYPVTEAAQKLHDSLVVADLHADTLLWRRDPAKRHTRGQTDLPRLREGGVDIQVFSAVTKSPRGLNFDGNSADAPDDITTLSVLQLWPTRTWQSIFERAVWQAQRLDILSADPKNKLVIAKRARDLEQPEGILVGVLATEGSHPLEGNIKKVQRLHDAGYRMMGLQHFFDNALGGSLHGRKKGGLTPFGREAVFEMRRLGIIIDVAHSSEAVVRDTLALIEDPVIISHGGLASYCPRTANRNMPDDILVEIARRGGLIGIGYFKGTTCDISPKGIADTIIAAIDLMGPDAVALGSDFDGSVATALDTSELAAITQELINAGLDTDTIRKVMGGNVTRFLAENLPQ